MLIRHCNQDILPDEVWYLKDFNGYVERFLLVGVCCICKQTVVRQSYIRKIWSNKFQRRFKKVICDDAEMFLYHHYIQKGFKLDYLINLTNKEKQFFIASAELELEEKQKIYQLFFG